MRDLVALAESPALVSDPRDLVQPRPLTDTDAVRRNTVRDLIQISKMGSYNVTQVLFRLLRSKLIRRRVAPMVV